LDSPITEKDGEYYRSSTGLEVGSTGMQGWRLEMEDAHISQDIPTRTDHLFVGVFDGHAGAGAAKFAAEHMIKFLLATAEWQKYLDGNCESVELLGEALINTFINLDEKMRGHQDNTSGLDTSGCTSVTAIVTPRYIICANAGDSRCVVGTKNSHRPLSEDHKPHSVEEKKRIESAGGFVQWNRVDGDLAVSRALGDFTYKHRPDLHPKDQKVTNSSAVLIFFILIFIL
jgi:serine/threonine protein phosphatase PrpC